MAGFILALFLKLELKYRGPWEIVKVIYKKCHSGRQGQVGGRQGQAETNENGQQQNSNAEQGSQEASNDDTAPKPPVRMCSVCVLCGVCWISSASGHGVLQLDVRSVCPFCLLTCRLNM